MKNLHLFLLIVFSTFYTQAQNQPFITTWEVTASDLSITIPTHSASTYNYTVDFGDGTVLTNQTGDATHTYNSAGTYTVSISGTFPRIYFNFSTNTIDHNKIKYIQQWGDIQWNSMENAFSGCYNLILNATDTPDLSQVTDISHMFYWTSNINQPINNWDVSNITNMEGVFTASYFNQPLNNWDVSNVTNMGGIFAFSNFNQPINNWDVSNVTNMYGMFDDGSFNQPLNNWDVSNVTNMKGMFKGTESFNQPLDNWDVSSVTDMSVMFSSSVYNLPLDSWDVSNVTDMSSMFKETNFNQALNNWDVSNVSDMRSMFNENQAFNQPLNNWDVSSVTDMFKMFTDASSFNQDLSSWSFNINVSFNYVFSANDFLSNSGFSVYNYDKLLVHFANLNLNNKWSKADGLEYCNINARDELINNQGWAFSGDSQSPDCNLITGNLLYDEANDGCTPTDIGINGFRINANDGSDDIYTYSSNGTFELNSIGTNFTVTVTNFPNYYSIAPDSQQVTFTTSNTEVADFCVTANQTIEDLNVVLIPISKARPGFDADYQLVVENIGTQTLANATVTLDFDDTMQSFVSASVTPTSTTTNQLTFDIANLQPLTFQTVDITMQTFQPPTVNGDDILSFTANVSPSANDFTPNDNIFVYDQTVVNSYDPNDKQVLQGEEIEIDEADEYLNYLIRFQNTGTASAINVRILDTLHPKLDYSTLRPVNASHNYRIEITNENEVEFIFDGINLPDQNTNEPASHGFVAYKIKPKSDVAVGDFITGDANIYFDFNAPIITNMVSTEVIDNLSYTNYGLENNISIYPNPTKNILHIEVKNNQEIDQIKIYNLSGLELMNVKENKQQLSLESLSAGVFFIQIHTNLGTVNKRFIKN